MSTNLWSIPIDTNSARVTGDRLSLTQVEGLRNGNPSLSRDGKNATFFSGRNLVVKDLVTGRETQLAQDVPTARGTGPGISPDGSFVVYYVENALLRIAPQTRIFTQLRRQGVRRAWSAGPAGSLRASRPMARDC